MFGGERPSESFERTWTTAISLYLGCMEEVGAVSLWLGTTDSSESLENVMRVFFSEDGDFEGSAFSRAFGIEFYDEDFREAENVGSCSPLIECLLAGFSYEDIIVPKFSAMIGVLVKGFNTVILLYNFKLLVLLLSGKSGLWIFSSLVLLVIGVTPRSCLRVRLREAIRLQRTFSVDVRGGPVCGGGRRFVRV